jgi:predicted RNase H-like HicB family nuclease
MKIRVIVHEAEEGGYWAEVPALRGCYTEGDTREELLANIQEAVEGILLGPEHAPAPPDGKVEEIDV